MLLGKEQGGTTVHGHHWDHDGHEVEVPYELALELLAIKGGGFYVPEPADDGTDPAGPGAPSKPRQKARQPADAGENAPAE